MWALNSSRIEAGAHPLYLCGLMDSSSIRLPVHAQSLSRVGLFATPWAVALQAPLSLGFSWQEHRSGLPFPPPRDLLDAGIKPGSPALAGRFFITELPGKPVVVCKIGEVPPHLAAVWRWSRYPNSTWNTADKNLLIPPQWLEEPWTCSRYLVDVCRLTWSQVTARLGVLEAGNHVESLVSVILPLLKMAWA